MAAAVPVRRPPTHRPRFVITGGEGGVGLVSGCAASSPDAGGTSDSSFVQESSTGGRRLRVFHRLARPGATMSVVPGFDGWVTETVLDGALDLLLGGACVGCARPGRLLCPGCAGELPGGAAPAWPTPVPEGLVEPWAAAAYDGTVREMVLGLKERRLLGLAVPLARLLAGGGGVRAAAWEPGGAGAGPVPTADRAGPRPRPDPHDHRPGGPAARRAEGTTSACAGCSGCGRGVVDQAGLDAAGRAANLAGSMRARAGLVRRLVPARSGSGRGLRRRPDHRLDRPRGPAGARGGRARGGPGGCGGGHPAPVPGPILLKASRIPRRSPFERSGSDYRRCMEPTRGRRARGDSPGSSRSPAWNVHDTRSHGRPHAAMHARWLCCRRSEDAQSAFAPAPRHRTRLTTGATAEDRATCPS